MALPALGTFYRFGPAIASQADNFTKQLNFNFAQFANLTNAANDAAAAIAGVPVGGLYRNGSVIQIRVS